MQLAPMGSQRCSVVGVTPMVESSTAGAAAFGGGTDEVVVALVFLDDPEPLHALPATSRAPQSAPTMTRDFVDIVSPNDGAERSNVPARNQAKRCTPVAVTYTSRSLQA
jgi:hypothetical protein